MCHKLFYLLHSMRHSVTWPNSRWWLAACDWLMSPLCRTIDTIRYIVRNVTNIWEWSSCTELRTETWKFCKQLCVFYGEWPLMVKFSKFCSESLHGDTDRRCCVQMSQNFSDAKFRLPLKLFLLRGSRPKSVRASPQQCTQSTSDFIQIGSLSA